MERVSASKSVFLTIDHVGKNYLPLVEDLKGKNIMYMDIVPMQSIPYNTTLSGFTSMNAVVSLADKIGNAMPIKEIPAKRFSIADNGGNRLPIMQSISLPNSYIDIIDPNDVGKVVVFVFWYQQNLYSASDTTATTQIDSIETNIITIDNRNLMPDLRALAGKRFRKLSFVAPAYSRAGIAGVTLTEAENIYISLYKGNYAVVDLLPLLELYDLYQLDDICWKNIQFDLNNSFVIVGGNNDYRGKVVFLNVTYEN